MICTTYFLTFFSELIPPTGIVYYLYIYNNTGKCSRGTFLGRCNRLPYSELSAFGERSTMRSAKRRFFIPQMEALNSCGRASV